MATDLTVLVAAYVGFVAVLAALASLPALAGLEQAARSGATVAMIAVTVLAVGDLVTVVAGHRPDELLAHLGYAVAAIGIGPVLLRRPTTDPPSAASAGPAPLPMVALAMLTTAVVVVRLGQTYR